ncbi:MAG TPA: PAS domain-containing protein, partial [Chitinophagaceae bacterium]|nr:PAS domain-containing protein [Chitinophagaceae bacterium]
MASERSISFPIPELYYTALFEAMSGNSILVYCDTPRFTILAATPEYLNSSGHTKQTLIGKGVFEAFPANHADPDHKGDNDLFASFQHVLLHKTPHFLPLQRYDLQNSDGSFTEKYWRASNKPVLAPNGEVAYIIHAAEDITSQVIAEKRETQIEGIEQAFDLFMDAPMVVGLVNGDDYVLEMANKEAFKLWGKGPEIFGKPILQGLPELEGQGIIDLFDQVRNSGQPFFAHEVPVTSLIDGKKEQHYFNLVYQPYYNNRSSKATGVFTISHDVTEQVKARQRAEESEAKFRTMAESTPVLIAVADETSNATYFN